MSAEQIYDHLNERADHNDSSEEDRGAGDPPENPHDAAHPREKAGEDDAGSPQADSSLSDKIGAVWDAPDPVQQAAEWQVAVKQAALAAQMMGRWPGDLKIAVDEACAPRVNWKALLRRFVQTCAAADYSWRRPNRRYTGGGLYLPEIRSEAMPPIVVAVDTSGSTERVLPLFKAELQSIVDECQPEATIVIMADAAVQRIDRFERGEPIEFHVEGLGGTDFRPVFDHVHHEQLDLACLIYLTDGFGTYPEAPSDFPTLWALTDSEVNVPWGDTVSIDAAIT